MSEQDREQPQVRITWVPHIKDPAAPTAEELAAGVPLGDEVIGDGLQFARDDRDVAPLALPASVTFVLVREPDYIVIRAAPDLPPGFLPERLDGCWFDRSTFLVVDDPFALAAELGGAVAVPTGRFEVRGDGAVAEVYEVRP